MPACAAASATASSPKSLSRVTTTCAFRAAYARISPSPGSAVQSPTHCRAGASGRLIRNRRFNPLVADDAPRVCEAGEDILPLQPRIGAKQIFGAVARCQHSENVLDGETAAADDRFASEDLRVDGDALEKVRFIHGGTPVSILNALLHQNADTMRDQSSVKGMGSALGAALWSVSMK